MNKLQAIQRANQLLAQGDRASIDAANRIMRNIKAGREEKEAGGIGDYLRAGAQGLSLGFSDEITGAMGALAGGDYRDIQQAEQAKVEQFKETHPAAALGTEIVGALAGGGALGMIRGGAGAAGALYGGAVKSAKTLPGRVGSNMVGGATAGAGYGAGTADPGAENIVGGALSGAAIGGAAGGALGPVVDRLAVGKTAKALKRKSVVNQIAETQDSLLADVARAEKLGIPAQITLADISPQAQNEMVNVLDRMMVSGDPATVKEAKRIAKLFADRNNNLADRVGGMLQGADMPFNAATNPAHFSNYMDSFLNHPNNDIAQVAMNKMMQGSPTRAVGATGNVRNMLEEFRSDVGDFMYGPHHAKQMPDMSDLRDKATNRLGHTDEINKFYNKHINELGAVPKGQENSWLVWQKVRSDMAKVMAKDPKTAVTMSGALNEIDNRLDTVAQGAFVRANAAYRDIYSLVETFDNSKEMILADSSGAIASTMLKEVGNMNPIEKMTAVYGMGEGMLQKIGTARTNGSISGFLNPTLAKSVAGETRHKLLRELVPAEQVKIVDYFAELEAKMAETTKRIMQIDKKADMSKMQQNKAQEFLALTGELSQQAVNTMQGTAAQVWAVGMSGNRIRKLLGIKVSQKDKELIRLLTETTDVSQKLDAELQKLSKKILKAGEISQQAQAQLVKFGALSGLRGLELAERG